VVAAVVGLLVLFFPAEARANAGVPMLVLVWPASWIAFVPIVLIEAFVARHVLALSVKECLRLSVVANLWSTLLGIPLAWLAMFVVEMGVGALIVGAKIDVGAVGTALLAPFMVAWIGPEPVRWQMAAAAAALCIPFAAASIWVEAWSARRRVSAERARTWARRANLTTYGLAFVALALTALVEAPE
jgi:hypothetical protein